MTIWRMQEAFVPGERELPMAAIARDWHQLAGQPAPEWALATDPQRLWLVVRHAAVPHPHPDAGPGDWREGLWQHDVAELFLAAADRRRYLEFNLSPRGAWWFARFSAARERGPDGSRPDVRVAAAAQADGTWSAALGIPLDFLKCELDWPHGPAANVTFILHSPDQRFFSASDLGGGNPDFHRPQRFRPVEWQDRP